MGRGEDFWPRPGRLLVASRSHTFRHLATAIDDAFARWDRAHLHEFPLAEETRIGRVSEDWDGLDLIDDTRTKLSRLQLDEQFAYVFDLGDSWEHLCTVGPERVDPLEVYGIMRLTGPSPTSAGAPSPTSTAGAGTAMTANPRCLQRRGHHAATSRQSSTAGALHAGSVAISLPRYPPSADPLDFLFPPPFVACRTIALR